MSRPVQQAYDSFEKANSESAKQHYQQNWIRTLPQMFPWLLHVFDVSEIKAYHSLKLKLL
jgi:hypothetical protein